MYEARNEYFRPTFILLKSPSHPQNPLHNLNEAGLHLVHACMHACIRIERGIKRGDPCTNVTVTTVIIGTLIKEKKESLLPKRRRKTRTINVQWPFKVL